MQRSLPLNNGWSGNPAIAATAPDFSHCMSLSAYLHAAIVISAASPLSGDSGDRVAPAGKSTLGASHVGEAQWSQRRRRIRIVDWETS